MSKARGSRPASRNPRRTLGEERARLTEIRDDPHVTVIGSGTSREGDRWILTATGDDVDPGVMLKVGTSSGHHSGGGYYGHSPSDEEMVSTYTRHDDVGPDQIIIRVTAGVHGVIVTLSDGRRDRLSVYPDPTHSGGGYAVLVYPRELDIHRIDLEDANGWPMPFRQGQH